METAQLPLFGPLFWSVSELTRHVRTLIEGDELLGDLWVQGEVSNLSRPASGHLYFTLKDSGSALKCVMWRTQVTRQDYLPRDGDAVEVHGALGVYEAGGQYQLYADRIRPLGQGLLFAEFLRLKASLEAEGLFAEERKRPLPEFPRCIGIVTSPSGAAIRDMLNTLRRRYPLARVVLAPTAVQGEEAPEGIANAIRALNRLAHPDVILLARGGGSIEDLWAFNDERVARAIAGSAAPVISGVGHETDFTIADFVADLRAPTPTAAAELATPDRDELKDGLQELSAILLRSVQAGLTSRGWQLRDLRSRLLVLSPRVRVESGRQRLDDLARHSSLLLVHRLQLERALQESLLQHLEALSPQGILPARLRGCHPVRWLGGAPGGPGAGWRSTGCAGERWAVRRACRRGPE